MPRSGFFSRRHACRLTPLACVLLSAWQTGTAWAQSTPAAAVDLPALALKPSMQLQQDLPTSLQKQMPTFLQADRVLGRTDAQAVAEGKVQLRRGDTLIRADRLQYFAPEDLVRATGGVRVNRAGNVFEGPELQLKVDTFEGFFLKPSYTLLRGQGQGHGQADRVDFVDEHRAVAYNASFTTCRRDPGPNWLPAWLLRATRVKFDTEADEVVAQGAQLRFQDVPILALPELSFSLSGQRRSGWLPPSMVLDNISGLELRTPYYFNLAPNRDVTLTPVVRTRRGIGLGGEFRYLEPSYSGALQANWMPNDRLRDAGRWGLYALHEADLRAPWLSDSPLALNLQLNRVSDDNYWQDFPHAQGKILTSRLLPSQASLAWTQGAFSAHMLAQRWQVLQNVSAPIVPPYDRLPQLSGQWHQQWAGLDVSLSGQYTRFEADRALTLQPNAERAHTVASISRRWGDAGWFFVPTAKFQWTSYSFDAPLADGSTSARRALPTFSLDTGLVLERPASFFGRDLIQTLEPRAYYVRTPYRDQSKLPLYDTGQHEFNFSSIFYDNPYVGADRIADNNLLTLGLTSRLLDPASGAEVVRAGVAQRVRLSDQRVGLPGQTLTSERLSDLLLYGSLSWSRQWGFDGTVQYNPKIGRSERSTLAVRYSPGEYRNLSVAYRLQRNNSEQVDIGWQWPLSVSSHASEQQEGTAGRWYSVGRLNYSWRDRKLVDALAGFEYDGGCWIGRVALERLQSSTTSATQRLMLQLEFSGLSRLGSGPQQTLQQNVTGYQSLRPVVTTPSRFSNYD